MSLSLSSPLSGKVGTTGPVGARGAAGVKGAVGAKRGAGGERGEGRACRQEQYGQEGELRRILVYRSIK